MVKHIVLYAGLALLVCLAVPAKAGTEDTYTLRELEKRATDRAPSVLAAVKNREAARAAHDRASYIAGPEVFARHRYYPESGTVTNEGTSTVHWTSLGIEQNILRALTVRPVERRAAGAAGRAAQAQLAARKQTALRHIRNLYCEAVMRRRSITIQSELKKVRQRIVQLLKERQEAGQALRSQLLEAKHARQKCADQKRYHRRKLEALREALAEATKLQPGRIKLELSIPREPLPPLGVLKREARRNHPRVRRKRIQARREDILSEKAGYEDVQLRAYAGYHMREDRTSETETGPLLGISFSMPLYIDGIAAAEARRRRARSSRRLMEAAAAARDLTSDVSDTYEEYRHYRDRLDTIDALLAAKKRKLQEAGARAGRSIAGRSADALKPLRIRAEICELRQDRQEVLMEKNQVYYSLLYLSGLSRSGVAGETGTRTKGLWAWNVEKITGDADAERRFAQLCSRHGFNRVFLGLDSDARRTFNVGGLLQKLASNGVQASCLLAGNRWIFPEHRSGLLKAVERVVSHNKGAPSGHRFAGVHLDLEPHALPEWEKQKKKMLRMLAASVEAAKDRLHERAPELTLTVDIPHFFDEVSPGLTHRIIEAADRVIIMAYGTGSPEEYRRRAEDEVEMASVSHTEVLLGLDSSRWPSSRRLDDFSARLLDRFSDTDVVGTAVHDFTDYRKLLEKSSP